MEENQVKTADTDAAKQENAPTENAKADATAANENAKPQADERRFSQDEVNKIVQDRLAKAQRKNDDELLKRLEALEAENKTIKTDAALTKAGISPDKKEDVIFYMKGKGVEISEETLAKELEKHPHWKTQAAAEPKRDEPKAEPKNNVSVKSVGSGPSVAPSGNSDTDAKFRALFKL